MDELIKIAGFICLILLALVEAAVILKLFGVSAPRLPRRVEERESVAAKVDRERQRVGNIDME